MAQGISRSPISINSALLRLPCTSPLQLTISPTQATAPSRIASSRRARSETPAMGASMAKGGSVQLPSFIVFLLSQWFALL